MQQEKSQKQFLFLLFPFIICIIWVTEIKRDFLPFADQKTRFLVEQVKGTGIYDFFRFVTNFGSTFFIIPFVIIIGILLLALFRDWLQAAVFAGGVLITSIVNTVVKLAVARQRPSINSGANAEGYSFPSGHSAVSLVCYGLLAYFLMRKTVSKKMKRLIIALCTLWIALIGISRFFINVHYITDILTGFFLGGMVFIGLRQLYETAQSKRSQS